MAEAFAGETQSIAEGGTGLHNMGVRAYESQRAHTADVFAGDVARHLRRPVARFRMGSVAQWLGRLGRLLSAPSAAGGPAMRQVEMLPLGRKHQIYLVECHGESFLIAASGESVSAPVAVARSGSSAIHAGADAR